MALLLLATGTGNTLLNARMLALRAYAPASLLQPALKLAAQVALGRLSGGGAAEVQGQKQQRRREAKRSERTRLFEVATSSESICKAKFSGRAAIFCTARS